MLPSLMLSTQTKGLEDANKRKRSEASDANIPRERDVVWLGVEMVPYHEMRVFRDRNFNISGDVNYTDDRIPLLIVPNYFVIASAESEGIHAHKVYREQRRGHQTKTLRDRRPTSPELKHPIWTNVSPFASHNITTAVGSPVVVAVFYTASMPQLRVLTPETANVSEVWRNNDENAQRTYEEMQGFYHEHFLVATENQRYVLIELYSNGVQVALGVTLYTISGDHDADINEATEKANKAMNACPWL